MSTYASPLARLGSLLLALLTILPGCDARCDLPLECGFRLQEVATGAQGGQEKDHWTGMTDQELLQMLLQRLNRRAQPTLPLGEEPNVKLVPLPVGVIVEDTEELECLAYTRRAGPGFLIVLDDDLHGQFLVDVLVHEWAHTLSFSDGAQTQADMHNDAWGTAYARAFRAGILDSQ
jgi:hypothetical protein